MTLQDIGIGTIADDGTGDTPRAGAIKINANNALIAAALSGAVAGSALAGTEKLLGLDGSTNKAWLVSQLATFIAAQIVDSAPGTLDTLNELAAALGDDANFATTVATALAGKQPLDADLTAIAALTTTSYGRGLLALADEAAAQTYFGVSGFTGTWRNLAASAVGWSHSGTTTEQVLVTLSNLLTGADIGANGIVRITALWGTASNDASVKTGRVKIGGTTVQAPTITSNRANQKQLLLRNRNSLSSQVAPGTTHASDYSVSAVAVATYSIDFSTAKDVVFTIQNGANGDVSALESYQVEVMYLP